MSSGHRAAVATVGDMHEAVEAALGVSEDANVGNDDEKRGRKRDRKEDDDEEGDDEKYMKRAVPSHEDQLAARRHKDRQRYASMTREYRMKDATAMKRCDECLNRNLSLALHTL
jgi:hypothetical protein